MNGESSLRLFKKLEAKHPDAKEIHVICDNASYYKSTWLKEKLKGSKIVFHAVFLKYRPGYSPNLNLIERLWLCYGNTFSRKTLRAINIAKSLKIFWRLARAFFVAEKGGVRACARYCPKIFTCMSTRLNFSSVTRKPISPRIPSVR